MPKRLTFEERSEIAYQTEIGEDASSLARTYEVSQRTIQRSNRNYWNRWNELRNPLHKNTLSIEGRKEYDQIKEVVKRLDESEAKRCDEAIKPLMERHQRTIDSLHKLGDVLEKMVGKG